MRLGDMCRSIGRGWKGCSQRRVRMRARVARRVRARAAAIRMWTLMMCERSRGVGERCIPGTVGERIPRKEAMMDGRCRGTLAWSPREGGRRAEGRIVDIPRWECVVELGMYCFPLTMAFCNVCNDPTKPMEAGKNQ